LRKVSPFELKDEMKVSELLQQYSNMEVLGAGELSRAVEVYSEMISKKAVVFLGLAGPLVPGGLREVITDLIRSGLVNVVVSTGANVVHDMIEAFGGCHYAGSFDGDDEELRKRGIGRAGNIYVPMEDFLIFERRCRDIFGGIPKKKRQDLSVKELLSVIGATIEDEGSFLRAAYDNGVPVFAPGVSDSMLGLQLFFYSQEKKIVLNVLKDMKDLADIVFKAEKTGALIIGGGVPKHYILGANTLRGGVEYAVQITTDRGEGGSLSGARLEEAISWGKADSKAKLVTLVGDATILFPLVALGVKERVRK
jgi:deoxyhypusine synthase